MVKKSFCLSMILKCVVCLFLLFALKRPLKLPLKCPYGHYLSIYYLSMHFNWKNSGFGTGSSATSPLPGVSRPSSHHHHAVRKCSCCTPHPSPTSPDTKKCYFLLFPWKCSRPRWTGLEATWFRASCPGEETDL